VRDKEGKPYSLGYEEVNPTVAQQVPQSAPQNRGLKGAMIVQQQKQIEALTVGLQKLSAQLLRRANLLPNGLKQSI
jgi:hypothetical protein